MLWELIRVFEYCYNPKYCDRQCRSRSVATECGIICLSASVLDIHEDSDKTLSDIFPTCISNEYHNICHTCHISHCEIKSHRIWPIWKAIPIKNSNLTQFSDHFTTDFMKN